MFDPYINVLTNINPCTCINKSIHVLLIQAFRLFICKIQGNVPSIQKQVASLRLHVLIKDLYAKVYRVGYCRNGRADETE